MRTKIFLSIATVVVLMTSLSAAPKSATAPAATIALNAPMTMAALPGAWPALGDGVTFSVSYSRTVERFNPRVQVLCYLDDTLVYGEAGAYSQEFLLGGAGSLWLYSYPAAGTHCVADLYYWSYTGGRQQFNWLASTSFDAAGAQ